MPPARHTVCGGPSEVTVTADPRRPFVAVALLGLLVLAGCGDEPAANAVGPAGPTTASGSATRSPTASATTRATKGTKKAAPTRTARATRTTRPETTSPATTAPGTGGGERLTVQGTVSARVGGCLLFTPGDMATSWVLVGAIDGLTPGQMVDVTGVLGSAPPPGCDQGPAFTVASARPR